MSIWRTIPEFPKYEITAEGDVRNKRTKTQLNETENKKTGAFSYNLRKADGRTTQRNFWGLVYQAFPELEPPKRAKPEPTEDKRFNKEWKLVPGFPRYQIHRDGRIRNRNSQHVMGLWQTTGEPYVILMDDSGRHRKDPKELLALAYPEEEKEAA